MIKEEIKDEKDEIKDEMRPKIHITNNPGRSIVSNCSFHTERVSKYLDEILNTIVENLGTYVKDSTQVLNIFENLKYTDNHRPILFTMDVVSLYTVIPHGEGQKCSRPTYQYYHQIHGLCFNPERF